MMRDVAHYFRDDGATIVAFQWSAHADLFLAIALVAAPPEPPSSPYVVYARFGQVRNKTEVDAFLHYLTTLSAPHKVMRLRSHGARTYADGSSTEHMEINVPNTDIALTIICDAADVAR